MKIPLPFASQTHRLLTGLALGRSPEDLAEETGQDVERVKTILHRIFDALDVKDPIAAVTAAIVEWNLLAPTELLPEIHALRKRAMPLPEGKRLILDGHVRGDTTRTLLDTLGVQDRPAPTNMAWLPLATWAGLHYRSLAPFERLVAIHALRGHALAHCAQHCKLRDRHGGLIADQSVIGIIRRDITALFRARLNTPRMAARAIGAGRLTLDDLSLEMEDELPDYGSWVATLNERKLTSQELTMLRCASIGLSQSEIGTACGIPYNRVQRVFAVLRADIGLGGVPDKLLETVLVGIASVARFPEAPPPPPEPLIDDDLRLQLCYAALGYASGQISAALGWPPNRAANQYPRLNEIFSSPGINATIGRAAGFGLLPRMRCLEPLLAIVDAHPFRAAEKRLLSLIAAGYAVRELTSEQLGVTGSPTSLLAGIRAHCGGVALPTLLAVAGLHDDLDLTGITPPRAGNAPLIGPEPGTPAWHALELAPADDKEPDGDDVDPSC
jgi:hypothetical protein